MSLLPGVMLRPEAIEDLRANVTFLNKTSTQGAARFLDSTQKTLLQLVDAPFIGSPRDLTGIDQRLHSLRAWPVGDFKQYLIYYRAFASGNGIEVWGVVHSSRDIVSHLLDALEEE